MPESWRSRSALVARPASEKLGVSASVSPIAITTLRPFDRKPSTAVSSVFT